MAKVPRSLNALLDGLVNSIQDNHVLVGIAADELSRLDRTIELKKAVAAFQKEKGKRPDYGDIRRLSKALPLVRAQLRKGFPFLHGMAAIAVWSELEAYIEDIAARYF